MPRPARRASLPGEGRDSRPSSSAHRSVNCWLAPSPTRCRPGHGHLRPAGLHRRRPPPSATDTNTRRILDHLRRAGCADHRARDQHRRHGGLADCPGRQRHRRRGGGGGRRHAPGSDAGPTSRRHRYERLMRAPGQGYQRAWPDGPRAVPQVTTRMAIPAPGRPIWPGRPQPHRSHREQGYPGTVWLCDRHPGQAF